MRPRCLEINELANRQSRKVGNADLFLLQNDAKDFIYHSTKLYKDVFGLLNSITATKDSFGRIRMDRDYLRREEEVCSCERCRKSCAPRALNMYYACYCRVCNGCRNVHEKARGPGSCPSCGQSAQAMS
eukprot:m.195526 g.195526  ORF g.195526 m.195526 type:complete len:129 (+) comp39517_c0_seq85:6201-6587(+)